jgi:hypothetical protein
MAPDLAHRPEQVLVECQCGQRLSLTASTTSCAECGTDHELAVKEASRTGTRATKPSTSGASSRIVKMRAWLFEMRHKTVLATSRDGS